MALSGRNGAITLFFWGRGGDWQGHRECHIGGDFLPAYKLDDNAKHGSVVFVRTGTHADLFE